MKSDKPKSTRTSIYKSAVSGKREWPHPFPAGAKVLSQFTLAHESAAKVWRQTASPRYKYSPVSSLNGRLTKPESHDIFGVLSTVEPKHREPRLLGQLLPEYLTNSDTGISESSKKLLEKVARMSRSELAHVTQVASIFLCPDAPTNSDSAEFLIAHHLSPAPEV